MKTKILINLTTLMLSTVAFSQTYVYKCGGPEYAMSPEIDAQVRYDKKTDSYTYKYKIKNASDALVPIKRFGLFTYTDVTCSFPSTPDGDHNAKSGLVVKSDYH